MGTEMVIGIVLVLVWMPVLLPGMNVQVIGIVKPPGGWNLSFGSGILFGPTLVLLLKRLVMQLIG